MQLTKQLIESLWPVTMRNIETIQPNGRCVYKVTADQGVYTIKLSDPIENDSVDSSGTREEVIFDFLQRHDFPAPRLIRTRDNKASARIKNRYATALTYIDGRATEPTPENYFKLGQTMAQLHNIEEEFPYKSSYLFDEEIAEMLKRAERADIFPEYVDVVNSLPNFSGLSEGLIHNDLGNGGNALLTPEGRIVPIDWDSAGKGPLLIDFGGVAGCLFGPDDVGAMFFGRKYQYGIADLKQKKAVVEAFYKGYLSRRRIDDRERDLIFDCGLVGCLSYCILDWVDYQVNYGMWQRVQFALENEQLIRSMIREWVG